MVLIETTVLDQGLREVLYRTFTLSKVSKMKLVIASRLHLGRASSPPSQDHIHKILENLARMAESLENNMETSVLVAVDATPTLDNYNYVETVQSALSRSDFRCDIQIVPVTPWGKFVPALNALVLHAKSQLNADLIMFVSAEVHASAETIQTLCQHVTSERNVIAAGAALNGHEYAGTSMEVPLTGRYEKGVIRCYAQTKRAVPLHYYLLFLIEIVVTVRTTPWNTLCIWDLDKLSMTGFCAISDLGKSAGVEECVAIALLQKLFPQSVAKLVRVSDLSWEETFQEDEERRKWHDEKMKSKIDRASQQLVALNLSGTVLHC